MHMTNNILLRLYVLQHAHVRGLFVPFVSLVNIINPLCMSVPTLRLHYRFVQRIVMIYMYEPFVTFLAMYM